MQSAQAETSNRTLLDVIRDLDGASTEMVERIRFFDGVRGGVLRVAAGE